jgi:hypothetical protein
MDDRHAIRYEEHVPHHHAAKRTGAGLAEQRRRRGLGERRACPPEQWDCQHGSNDQTHGRPLPVVGRRCDTATRSLPPRLAPRYLEDRTLHLNLA